MFKIKFCYFIQLFCSKTDDVIGVALVFLGLTLNIFHTLSWCFHCYFEPVTIGWDWPENMQNRQNHWGVSSFLVHGGYENMQNSQRYWEIVGFPVEGD